jgi:hypothetical protein
MARPPEPTPEQLRLAWRQMRDRNCPGTLEAALAHPVYGPCIKGLARNLHRASACVPAPVRKPDGYVPPTPTAPPNGNRTTPKPLPRFDAKRAQANDFDD